MIKRKKNEQGAPGRINEQIPLKGADALDKFDEAFNNVEKKTGLNANPIQNLFQFLIVGASCFCGAMIAFVTNGAQGIVLGFVAGLFTGLLLSSVAIIIYKKKRS